MILDLLIFVTLYSTVKKRRIYWYFQFLFQATLSLPRFLPFPCFTCFSSLKCYLKFHRYLVRSLRILEIFVDSKILETSKAKIRLELFVLLKLDSSPLRRITFSTRKSPNFSLISSKLCSSFRSQ